MVSLVRPIKQVELLILIIPVKQITLVEQVKHIRLVKQFFNLIWYCRQSHCHYQIIFQILLRQKYFFKLLNKEFHHHP